MARVLRSCHARILFSYLEALKLPQKTIRRRDFDIILCLPTHRLSSVDGDSIWSVYLDLVRSMARLHLAANPFRGVHYPGEKHIVNGMDERIILGSCESATIR
ncbi:hypothetical protein ACLOJK_012195 [Asimina triloba]